jgi:hypothetical protein
MKFTPGQAQETLRLSPATFRHWKNALPPLAGRNGYSPCFTPGDLLAMAVIKSLTEDVGIRVGNLYTVASHLFEECARAPWAGLERLTLIINPSRNRVATLPEAQPIPKDGLAIVLPLRPIVAALRATLLLEQEEISQETLRFPPTALTGSRQRQSP